MHRRIYCKKVKDGIKCCAGNADQSDISVEEKGSPDAKPYLNNCKQNNQDGGCDIREAQMGNIDTGQISRENIKGYKVIKSGSKAGQKFFSTWEIINGNCRWISQVIKICMKYF